jgi:hypothetical protein
VSRKSVLSVMFRAVVGVVMLFVTFSVGAQPAMRTCRSSLPAPVNAAVRAQEGWKLVELSDLRSDDKEIWRGLKHGQCPGIARGDFDGSGTSQYALLMIDKSKARFRLLHATKQRDGQYLLHTLDEGASAVTPVIYRGQAGKYTGSENDTAIVLKQPPIILAVLESGATAYYFSDGKAHRLMISE